jgi:hypothetical protein
MLMITTDRMIDLRSVFLGVYLSSTRVVTKKLSKLFNKRIGERYCSRHYMQKLVKHMLHDRVSLYRSHCSHRLEVNMGK